MRSASAALQSAVQSHIRTLLIQPDFADRLPGLISNGDRTEIVLERLRAIAGLPNG